MFSNKIQQKTSTKYSCENCDYHTKRKSNYDEHLLTSKHKFATFSNENPAISSTKFTCPNCSKKYNDNSGLWRHKKKCIDIQDNSSENMKNDISNIDTSNKDNLIEYLIKENAEFKTLILELVKKDNNNLTNINSHNVNSNNKTFNLQFFLNEQCKDALNISDFVDSIKLQLTDLETTGRLGYVEGVSKILIKNLNELDAHKRPIHCSDLKREVLYIKDDDKWSKEDDEKHLIKKAIKDVANKNIRQIPEWTNQNPDCKQSDSKKNDQYLNIVMNSMSGGTNEEQSNNIEKIVKNISKSVFIDK
jgi:predicted RNA-binding Zn-ribbon protein involved in translation (DUF1610 family)